MTIVSLTKLDQVSGSTADRIGQALYEACMAHFVQFLGQTDIGIGYGSCAAAVAITHNPQYGTVRVDGVPEFSVIFGLSQMFKGLDPDFNKLHGKNIDSQRKFSDSKDMQEHAEQSAIRTAVHMGRQFFELGGESFLYVDLDPCEHCGPWLQHHPGKWHVYYHSKLADKKRPIEDAKKKLRKAMFGRQTEG